MSHHFGTQLVTGDPRLNVTDAYLFDAAPDRTMMVMTCGAPHKILIRSRHMVMKLRCRIIRGKETQG
jgi:hypothetical protein